LVNFGGPCNECFMDIWSTLHTTNWYILWPFGIYLYGHLVHFVVIWYIFPHFGMLCQHKSGNPDLRDTAKLLTRFLLINCTALKSFGEFGAFDAEKNGIKFLVLRVDVDFRLVDKNYRRLSFRRLPICRPSICRQCKNVDMVDILRLSII
jgi:hypothetical protein